MIIHSIVALMVTISMYGKHSRTTSETSQNKLQYCKAMPREVKAEKKAQKGRDCGNVSASPAKGEDAASHLATWQTKSETQGTEKRNEGRKETKTLVHLAKAKPTLALHSEEPRTLRCRRGSADKATQQDNRASM